MKFNQKLEQHNSISVRATKLEYNKINNQISKVVLLVGNFSFNLVDEPPNCRIRLWMSNQTVLSYSTSKHFFFFDEKGKYINQIIDVSSYNTKHVNVQFEEKKLV